MAISLTYQTGTKPFSRHANYWVGSYTLLLPDLTNAGMETYGYSYDKDEVGSMSTTGDVVGSEKSVVHYQLSGSLNINSNIDTKQFVTNPNYPGCRLLLQNGAIVGIDATSLNGGRYNQVTSTNTYNHRYEVVELDYYHFVIKEVSLTRDLRTGNYTVGYSVTTGGYDSAGVPRAWSITQFLSKNTSAGITNDVIFNLWLSGADYDYSSGWQWISKLTECMTTYHTRYGAYSVPKLRIVTDFIPLTNATALYDKYIQPQLNKLARLERFREMGPIDPYYPQRMGKCCKDAIENVSYVESNMISYIKEAPETFGEISSFIKLLEDVENPSKWAQFFLSYQYGTRLTIDDTMTASQGLARLVQDDKKNYGYRTSRSRLTRDWSPPLSATNGKVTYCYKLTFDPFAGSGLGSVRSLMNMCGLWPTGKNLYDLLPYSFVLNWFINLQDVIADFDAAAYSAYLNVISETMSEKYTYSVSLPTECTGTLLASLYKRTVHPYTTVTPCVESIDTMSFPKHILEGSALIVARRN